MKALKEAIREHRKARLETQAQYAEYLGVSRAAVCAWEAGTRTPTMAMARLLVDKGLNKRIVIAAVAEQVSGAAA